MRSSGWHRIARAVVSCGFLAVAAALCARVPHINGATMALLMVLYIGAVARTWSRGEAVAAAIVGGVSFDYFFVGRPGFAIAAVEDGIALAAFVVTAITTAQLAVLSERRRIEAVERRNEMEKLYRLAQAMLGSDGGQFSLPQLTDHLRDIFGAEGVALYDTHTGQVVRSGVRAAAISDQALHETAASGRPLDMKSPGLSLVPIRDGNDLVGSVGISGRGEDQRFLNAVAAQVGLGLARLYAIKKATDAEVVRRAEELKSAVLDSMAHEIRNPLNSVKMAATTLLAERTASEWHTREMLTIIDEEVNRMDRFLDKAVQVARAEGDHFTLKKEPHSLAQLIPAVIREMGELAAHRQIQVSVPESLPLAECDKEMISRVMTQLLNNALKYSPGNSPVTVSANFTGTAIVIRVADGGPGVAEDERHRIFDKYYRGSAASSGTPGTGLGLPAAKCIIEAHGGEIWVTNRAGGGAAFHVSLPVAGAARTVGVM